MTRHLRLPGAVGLLIGAALALAGCMQLDMSLTVNTDDTIDGQLLLTADKQILTSDNTRTLEQGFADLRRNIPAMPDGEETVYQDAKRYGSLIS
jgi:LppM domain